jgi:UDP-2,3-diacylglucosamine hydrolase
MATLFISDLHMCAEHPEITERFLRLLRNQAREIEALYILGDLFDVWLGDDAILPEYQEAIDALNELANNGIPAYFMHGNRDFLIGDEFSALTGCRLLHDPTVIDLYGQNTLLMHGDTLCTDDEDYQQFRAMVRNPDWQAGFLALSPEERAAFAQKARYESSLHTNKTAEAIMDVNQQMVEEVMAQHGVTRLIHGHTHRPDIHEFTVDGQPVQRIVLSDWGKQGNVLICDEEGCQSTYFS